jgi:delta1-piperideine-2-carboxylate reductase
MPKNSTKSLTLEAVRVLAKSVLVSSGMDDHGSDVIADLVTMSERDGPRSHGLAMLPRYVQAFRSGYANGAARPTVERIAPGVLRGDGDNGFYQIASNLARPQLIEAARENGIAGFTCANVHHLAALRFETEALAREGLIGISVVNSLALIVPHGGDKPVFGTNPMSFACPRDRAEPVVWDQSSSVVAFMDIKLAAAEGHELPVPGGLDRQGRITTNATEICETASLLPFAGHKGTGIALMVEILAAALAGGTLSTNSTEKDSFESFNVKPGVTTIAIDPSKWGNPAFLAQVGRVVSQIDAMPGARVPGDGRLKRRSATAWAGITISGELWEQLELLV